MQNVDVKCINCNWAQKYALMESHLQRMLALKDMEIEKFKQQNASLMTKLKEAIIPSEKASKEAIIFSKVIVSGKQVYSDDVKAITQNIEYISSKAYFFMRDSLGFQLPSRMSLHNWRPIKWVKSGIDPRVVQNLKLMTQDLKPYQKECVLLLDEVSINQDLAYNKSTDRIDGVVDISNGNRSQELATKALVFMIKSIFGSWKYVLSYYATSTNLNKFQLKDLILENVKVAESIGLSVAAIVLDQGAVNIATVRFLGATEYKPYFFSTNRCKVFIFHDYCHLLKCVRNTLLTCDIETFEGTASMTVIKLVYEADRDIHIRMLPRLTESHMNPTGFEKMRVSRAAQVLSGSMATAITSKKYGAEDFFSEEVLPLVDGTINFVSRFNKLFDVLNSKNINDKNPLKRGYYRDSADKIDYFLEFIEYLRSLKFRTKSLVKWLNGFIMTLNGLMQVSDHIFKKHESVKYILFGKFNQDALENIFFKIRSRGGSNTHPTIHELQYTLARIISMKITAFKYDCNKNCHDDDEVMLEWTHAAKETEVEIPASTVINLAVNKKNLGVDLEQEEYNWDDETEVVVETIVERPHIVLQYYTGYCVFAKYVKKIKCDECISKAKGPSSLANTFTEEKAKNKDNIVVPSQYYYEFSKKVFDIYKNYFLPNYECLNLREMIISTIKEDEAFNNNGQFASWFEKNPCFEHHTTLLDFYITVLLYKNSKFLKQELLRDKIIPRNCSYRSYQKWRKLIK